jgi:hypothetical protein
MAFIPFLGWAIIALVLLYIVVMLVRSVCGVEVHHAEQAAAILYNYNHGKTPELPPHLQGVFWMSTNAAPELLATLEGSSWDVDRRMLNLDAGANYNWTYSNDVVGWFYWLALRVSYIFCAEMKMTFNEELTEASMPLYICGCCPDSCPCDGIWLPTGMIWRMKQDPNDENAWDREIYLYVNPSKIWEFGSYRLIRIIDQNGQKLPSYADMVEQSTKTSADAGDDTKLKIIYGKPEQQIMNGADCVGNVFFGKTGNPEEYMQLP